MSLFVCLCLCVYTPHTHTYTHDTHVTRVLVCVCAPVRVLRQLDRMMGLLDPAGAGTIGYEGFKALMATHFNVVASSTFSPTASAATPGAPLSPAAKEPSGWAAGRYFA